MENEKERSIFSDLRRLPCHELKLAECMFSSVHLLEIRFYVSVFLR